METLAADYSSSSSASSPRPDVKPESVKPESAPAVPNDADLESEANASSPSNNSSPDGHDGSADGFELISVNRTESGSKRRTSEFREEKEKTALEVWVADALQLRHNAAIELNEAVRQNRNFRNPSILQKMISYCGIDEYASNIDTPQIGPEECYDAIAERQRKMVEEG